jgi:hypothetical protein
MTSIGPRSPHLNPHSERNELDRLETLRNGSPPDLPSVSGLLSRDSPDPGSALQPSHTVEVTGPNPVRPTLFLSDSESLAARVLKRVLVSRAASTPTGTRCALTAASRGHLDHFAFQKIDLHGQDLLAQRRPRKRRVDVHDAALAATAARRLAVRHPPQDVSVAGDLPSPRETVSVAPCRDQAASER